MLRRTHDRTQGSSRFAMRPWTQAGVVALLFVALVAGLLALPGGNVVGDTTSNIKITTVLPMVTPGAPLIQPFVASADRLASVYVTFVTSPGDDRCRVRVSLLTRAPSAAPGTGTGLDSEEWSCTELPNSGRFEALQFPPIEDSAGTTYDVVIDRIEAGGTGSLGVWAGEPKGDALPAVVDGAPQELSASVRGEYDPQPHRWDHLGQTLTRLAAFGPPWGTAGAFVALVVLMGALVALAPVASRSTRSVVIVVSLLALVRGLAWSAAVPALEAMDEPAHFGYVQYLAEEGKIPGRVDNHEDFSERLWGAIDEMNVESTTPGDRPDFSPGASARAADRLDALSPQGGGGGPGSMYAPFYYLPAVAFYHLAGGDILAQITFARLWSVLLGMAAAGLLVVLGRQLFPRSSGAQMGFIVAAVLQPMIAHQFAVVNNDGWVITAGFAALSVGLALARRGRAPGLALLAGAIIGAGLLGKPFAIACAVPLAVGWLVGKVRARERSLRVLAGEVGLVIVGFGLTFGLWTLAAARLDLNTSEVPAQTATGQTVAGYLDAQFGHSLYPLRAIWADQLWGDFGWVRIPLPPPIPLLIFVIEGALMVGLVVWAILAVRDLVGRRRTGRAAGALGVDPSLAGIIDLRDAPLPLDVRILMVAVTIVGTIVTLYAAGWVYYASTGANDLLQGRYALLAVPAFIAGPALLLERFSGGRVRPAVVNTVAAFGMVSANLLGLLVVLESFYG